MRLYVTINANPKLIDFAFTHNINVIDCAGNFCLRGRDGNSDVTFVLSNKGEKPIEVEATSKYPIFKEVGLKVIFFFLLEKSNVNKPYREIQKATGVAIGSVKNVIDGMVSKRFVKVEGRKRILINVDRLLTLWALNYGQNLKPKLLEGHLAFRNEKVRTAWDSIEFPQGAKWGAEPAAAIAGGYLTPGEFSIYTSLPLGALVKTGAFMTKIDGDIPVYRAFWRMEDVSPVVPAILIYADLIDSGNSRCAETANKMKENELKYLF